MVDYKAYSGASRLAGKINWMYYSNGSPFEPEFEVIVFSQKGRDVYLGHLPSDIIDVITFVPEIDSSKSYDAMAEHLLSDPLLEWQRSLDGERIGKIGTFWADEDSYVVNPVILGVRDNTYSMEHGKRTNVGNPSGFPNDQPLTTATIKLNQWQSKSCPVCGKSLSVAWKFLHTAGHAMTRGAPSWLWAGGDVYGTRCPDDDCEGHYEDFPANLPPLYLIDGQHRIRGTNSLDTNNAVTKALGTHLWYEEQIGFSLLKLHGTNKFDVNEQGKVFSDINTKAVGLDSRHKLYMLWKFKDKGVVDKEDIDMSVGSYDRVAYEATLRLIGNALATDGGGNPISNRIAPLIDLPDDSEHYYLNTILSFAQAFQFIKKRMVPTRPFRGLGRDPIATCLFNYLDVIREVWDRIPSGGGHFWVPTIAGSTGPPLRVEYLPTAADLAQALANSTTPAAEAKVRIAGFSGKFTTPANKERTKDLHIMTKDIFDDVVYLTGWRPGNPLPSRGDMLNVVTHLSTCEFSGTGWTTPASRDEDYVRMLLRDYLYSVVGGAHITNRYAAAHGAIVPTVPAGGRYGVHPAFNGMDCPTGVENEITGGMTINDFIGTLATIPDSEFIGSWLPPTAHGPKVDPAAPSSLRFFMPINVHGNFQVEFSQQPPTPRGGVAPPPIVKGPIKWTSAGNRYSLVSPYPAHMTYNDGIKEIELLPGVHYTPGNGPVRVIVKAPNLAGTATNTNVVFDT